MVDLIFHELLPFVENSFSGLFSAMLSHIWMKVGSKFQYEELQIKFDIVTVDLIFHELLPFAQKSFSGLFSAILSYIWMKVGMKVGSKLPYEVWNIK